MTPTGCRQMGYKTIKYPISNCILYSSWTNPPVTLRLGASPLGGSMLDELINSARDTVLGTRGMRPASGPILPSPRYPFQLGAK